jgi:beta-lactamase regulating signal transducer with metallopeptidase domain
MKICDTSKPPAVVRKRSEAACKGGHPHEKGEIAPVIWQYQVSSIIHLIWIISIVVVVIEQIIIHRY